MDEAMRRFSVLRPHLEDGVSLATAARGRSADADSATMAVTLQNGRSRWIEAPITV